MNCKHCQSACIKKGKRNNIQKYRCKSCLRYSQAIYKYRACAADMDSNLVLLVKEGVGINSMARIQNISPKTVVSKLLRIGAKLRCPFPVLQGKSYEVDELFTFIGKKSNEVCIAYALERDTRSVVAIALGTRTKIQLTTVIHPLLLRNAKRISTDGLAVYASIIPARIHCLHRRGTNRIERQNLNLRTHLKRLNRRTICFSKSAAMLLAVVKIYFWG